MGKSKNKIGAIRFERTTPSTPSWCAEPTAPRPDYAIIYEISEKSSVLIPTEPHIIKFSLKPKLIFTHKNSLSLRSAVNLN